MHRIRSRILRSAARRPWFVWFGRLVIRPVDLAARRLGLALRLRRPLSAVVAGVPGAYLVTVGRRTGQRRTTPVVPIDVPFGVGVIASNWGQERRPGWYHNLVAEPRCLLDRGGEVRAHRARRATDEERATIWQRATAIYPAWEAYDARTARELDVFLLEPVEEPQADGAGKPR